jgi:outer membrane protein OmpA-like peptidoglycan-associated protein
VPSDASFPQTGRFVRESLLFAILAGASPAFAADVAAAPRIPLCAGLTVVTAISQKDGDYESIKSVESVDARSVHIKYSSERMVSDIFSTEPPHLERTAVHRKVLVADLAGAKAWMQQFNGDLAEEIPGTTAIGTSAAVLNALKTRGEIEFGVYQAIVGKPSMSRGTHPNVYDYQTNARIRRLAGPPATASVIVNDQRVELPVVRAGGDYFGDKAEFVFLDDPANPIALRFRYGIDAVASTDPATPQAKRDRDSLQVVKISIRCAGTTSDLDRQLAASGQADVYDIHFTFASDQLREESEPALREIADVLARHPDWKLRVQGHTDSVGSDKGNIELSQKRAAAVKQALVARYRIDASRLVTAGFGASRPRDSNETLAGRARNRRVELVKL